LPNSAPLPGGRRHFPGGRRLSEKKVKKIEKIEKTLYKVVPICYVSLI
jgi:hypothetical protein